MTDKSLDQIFHETEESEDQIKGRTLTVWVPAECKDAYDRLQKSSRRAFSKKLRKLVQTAIELAEKRVS